MFLNKFRNKYWFNILSIGGWIVLLLFCKYLIPNFSYFSKPGGGDIALLLIGMIIGTSLISAIIAFLVYVLELIFTFRITNEKILNNKIVNIFRNLGILFIIIPLIVTFLTIILLIFYIIICKISM